MDYRIQRLDIAERGLDAHLGKSLLGELVHRRNGGVLSRLQSDPRWPVDTGF